MPLELFFAILIISILIIGSYTDIRTREVPDIVNYGFIFSALAFRLIWSIANSDWSYIIEGLLGFAVGVALAYAMFYAGQWGGGDAKMMMGLGAMIGLTLNFESMLVSFLFNVFLIGAVYALVWSIFLAVINRKRFKEEFMNILYNKSIILGRRIVVISAIIMVILALSVNDVQLRFVLFAFVGLYLATFLLWIFVKVIEKSCMIKLVPPEKLTEGDWIVKDIVVGGKRITGPKDLGISLEQIAQLKRLKKQKKIKEVLIKEGIPFVPSFLISFIVTWILGNMIMLFV